MKKLLRSTMGTLAVVAFLAIASPMYARGGHGGHGGHAVRGHVAASHVKGGHAGFHAPRGGGQRFARATRGGAHFAGRARNWNGGRHWGGNYWYPSHGYSGSAITDWVWLSILREWLLRLPLRWVLSILRKLGILPLPLWILAVRELQLRV